MQYYQGEKSLCYEFQMCQWKEDEWSSDDFYYLGPLRKAFCLLYEGRVLWRQGVMGKAGIKKPLLKCVSVYIGYWNKMICSGQNVCGGNL